MSETLVRERTRFYIETGFSCSETTFRVLCDLYGLTPSEEVLRMTSTWRGGCNLGGKCGIAEAATAFTSYALGKTDLWKREDIEQIVRAIHADLEAELGSYQCAYLWDMAQARSAKTGEDLDCVIYEGAARVAQTLSDQIDQIAAKQTAESGSVL